MPIKYPCSVCKFNVRNNHRASFCDIYQNWTRHKSTPFTSQEYTALSNSSDDWFCSTCLASIFPFNHIDNDTDFFFAMSSTLKVLLILNYLNAKKINYFLTALRHLIS